MADITLIEDHVEQAQARLVDQFRTADRLRALIECLVQPIQDIEDALNDVRTQRSIDTAEGVQLDELGAIVGQLREGRTDDVYRIWISARIIANRATGKADDSLKVMKLIDSNAASNLTEYFPAAYMVSAYLLSADPSTVSEILRSIKPAGVAMWFEYSTFALGTLFTFGDADNPTTDPALGFGDATDPDRGGRFVGVIQ